MICSFCGSYNSICKTYINIIIIWFAEFIVSLFGFQCPSLPPVHRSTALHVEQFVAALCNHPDRSWVAYVLHGLRFAFNLGFSLGPMLESGTWNNPSVLSVSRKVT